MIHLRSLCFRRRPPRKRGSDDGFTMIEVLMTLLLLTIVLLGLAALQIATIRQVSTARRASGALRLAQALVEEYQSRPFAQLPSVGTPDWETEKQVDGVTDMVGVAENGTSPGPFTVHRFVEVPATSGDRVITVRVSWLDIMPGANVNPTQEYRTLDVLLTVRRIDL